MLLDGQVEFFFLDAVCHEDVVEEQSGLNVVLKVDLSLVQILLRNGVYYLHGLLLQLCLVVVYLLGLFVGKLARHRHRHVVVALRCLLALVDLHLVDL